MPTMEELRDRLKRRPGMGHLTDEQADDLLAEAADAARDYCGWHIWPEVTEQVTVDTLGGPVCPLPTLMLHEVTAVETRPRFDLDPGAWEAVTSGWDWSEAGWLLRCGSWPDGPRAVRPTIRHGYTDPPGAIGSVLLAGASRSETVPTGVSAEQSGGESISYATAAASEYASTPGLLSAAEHAVLDKYRLANRP